MRIAYFDCSAGATAEMLLGALVDAGVPVGELQGYATQFTCVAKAKPLCRAGLQAMSVECVCGDGGRLTLPQLLALLDAASFPVEVTQRTRQIMQRWAEAEARLRGQPVDECLYAQVTDLAQVIGAVGGLRYLGVEQVGVSAFPLSTSVSAGGHSRGASTLAAPLLMAGFPVRGADRGIGPISACAAAVLTALASFVGPLPEMVLDKVAHGATEQAGYENSILRLWIGRGAGQGLEVRTLYMVETNIDDMNPELYDYVMAQLFASGALDVALLPMQMKKNRPATLLRVLCGPTQVDVVRDILLHETTTLGVRVHAVQRFALPRHSREVETPWGKVRVKVAELPGGRSRAIPEYEDCRRLAEAAGVPLWEVYRAAQVSAAGL